MLPEHIYMTDLGKIAYVALYLPLVLGSTWLFCHMCFRKIRLAWPLMTGVAAVLLTLPFWDVYRIGRDAARLCNEEGGLHVYKTVEAEGFWGGSAERWLDYGFNFVESGGGDKMSRYTMEDGVVVHQRIQAFISRYASGAGDNHKPITSKISRSSQKVIDRSSGEVLSELVIFNVYPGWFDGIFLKLSGSGPVTWHCGDYSLTGGKLNYGDLVIKTLKPSENMEGTK